MILFDYDELSGYVEFRHYYITAQPSGVGKRWVFLRVGVAVAVAIDVVGPPMSRIFKFNRIDLTSKHQKGSAAELGVDGTTAGY